MPETFSPALNECAIAFDLAGQQIVFASPAIEKLLGYSPAAFNSNPNLLFDMIDPAYRAHIKERVDSLRDGQQLNLYYPVYTASNEQQWVQDRKSIAESASSGQKILLSLFTAYNPKCGDAKDEALVREQFLDSLIESQTNFLIRFDINGNFTFANKRFLKSLGYRKNELNGKHFSIVTIPEEIEMCRKAFVNCLKNPGKVVPLAHKKRDKAGNLLDTEWEFVAVANDDGAVIAVQGIGHDITHKIVIEREMKAAAEKLDTFIESVNDYFFILDKEWKFARVNTAFEKLTGRSRSELLGRTIWEAFPVILNSPFEHAYREAAAENKVVHFTEHVPSADMWFNVSIYPSAEGLTVFMQDMTGVQRAQEESLRTRNSLEALINNTEDQIWSVDKNYRYVYLNKAYRKQILQLTGKEPKEGDLPYENEGFNIEERSRWDGYYRRALDGQRYSIISESTDPETGRLLSFDISFNPIYKVKGDITGVGCFARDITKWLETEKAIVEQNERLRHIASLTSHELRRPVASMLGLINILDRRNFFNPDNKEVIEHLFTVANEIDEVIRLIVDKTILGDRTREKHRMR
jgi:PAS domain S-box-containing protein